MASRGQRVEAEQIDCTGTNHGEGGGVGRTGVGGGDTMVNMTFQTKQTPNKHTLFVLGWWNITRTRNGI